MKNTRTERTAALLIVPVFLLSLLALLGWLAGIRELAGISVGWIPMAPTTAFSFLLYGGLLALHIRFPVTARIRYLFAGGALLIAGFCCYIIVLDLFGAEHGLEAIFVPEPELVGGAPVGRMSVLTATSFFLLSTGALAAMSMPGRRVARSASSVAALMAGFIGLVATMGYFYGEPLLYGGDTVPMALTTAVAFCFLGLSASLHLGTGFWPMGYFHGNLMRARLLRVFVPLMLVLVILQGWFVAVVHTQFEIEAALVSALAALIFIFVASGVVFRVARGMGSAIDRAEAELHESELRYRRIVDTATEGVWMLDSDGRTSFVNPQLARMLGYDTGEVIGKPFYSFMDEGDRQDAERLLSASREGHKEQQYDFRLRRMDGSRLWAIVSTNPVLDDSGGFQGALALLTDITDRKQAERALMESEEKYRQIFAQSRDAVFIATPDGRFLDINPAGRELLGIPADADPSMLNMYHDTGALAGNLTEASEAAGGKGFIKDYEFSLRRKDGESLILTMNATPELDKSGVPRVYRGIFRDITEHRLLEQQLMQAQKMESIGRLAGGVAHDFNNYLTAIEGYIDLALMRLPEDSPVTSELMGARSSADRAAELARDLLLFSRREPASLRPLDVNSLLDNMQRMLTRLIGERYALEVLAGGAPAMVLADAGQLEQVVMNLVVNARDAMPSGGRITLAVEDVPPVEAGLPRHPQAGSGPHVRIRVSDEGIGMEAETIAHIFEPFFSTKQNEGTGLGLSVVYGIVQQHQGWIEVENQPGQGATFLVYLPLTELSQVKGDGRSAAPRDYRGHGERILLVEDEDSVRELAERMLVENGYEVVAVGDAEAAREVFLAGEDFELLFSDIVMPGEDGISLANELRRRRPGLKILLASGYIGEELDMGAIHRNGYEFLQKPYQMEGLLRTVTGLLHA